MLMDHYAGYAMAAASIKFWLLVNFVALQVLEIHSIMLLIDVMVNFFNYSSSCLPTAASFSACDHLRTTNTNSVVGWTSHKFCMF